MRPIDRIEFCAKSSELPRTGRDFFAKLPHGRASVMRLPAAAGGAIDMDRFLSKDNLGRLQKLRDPFLSTEERRQLLELLSAESAHLKQDLRVGKLPYEHRCS